MYYTVTLERLKEEIAEQTELAALATLKLQNPAFDEVKLKDAYKIAGSERWLKYHIKQGHIKPVRRGTASNSPIYYSRLEIAALKRAEKEMKFNDEQYRKYGKINQ
jgi:hypothetical protein